MNISLSKLLCVRNNGLTFHGDLDIYEKICRFILYNDSKTFIFKNGDYNKIDIEYGGFFKYDDEYLYITVANIESGTKNIINNLDKCIKIKYSIYDKITEHNNGYGYPIISKYFIKISHDLNDLIEIISEVDFFMDISNKYI